MSEMLEALARAMSHLHRTWWYIPHRLARAVPWIVPDKLYIMLLYRYSLGRWPNLKSPRRFTEKLQWLKLHDRNPLYTRLVDKIQAKQHVAEILGPEYVFKTIGVWGCPNEIEFEKLPNQFVLKCNHYGGGAVFICKDKTTFDCELARKELRKQLKRNIFWSYREWPYKNVSRKVFAEEYMEDDSGSLRDYKFYCLNGEPQFVLVVSDRYGAHHYDGYDMDFNSIGRVSNAADPSDKPLPKPPAFKEMVGIAKKLSTGFKFVRIDLYEIRGRVYFGEYTFYPASGLNNRNLDEWDLEFGKKLNVG